MAGRTISSDTSTRRRGVQANLVNWYARCLRTLWIYIIHVYLWVYYFRHFSESLPHTYWMTLVVFLALLGVSYPLSVLMDRVWAGLQGRALKICHVSE